MHILAPRRCRMQTNDSQNGKETFPVPKIKMPQPKSSGPPDRRNLREGKVLIFMIYIFMIYIFSYNARYVKQREAKKPSFPDFGSFGVPPAFRPPMPRFADFAAIYLFFMILYFVFIII